MSLSTQDFVKGVDLTTQANSSLFNNVVDNATPKSDKGLIASTTDTALNTPDVPDAGTTTKWKQYLWKRTPHSTATNKEPLVYMWDESRVSDATYKKWVLLNNNNITSAITTLATSVANARVAAYIPVYLAANPITYSQLSTDLKGRVINVKDYGATGDGVTNDTTSIQNAINALQSAGGGRLYFPKGVYRVVRLNTLLNDPTNNYALVMTGSNIHWTGDGIGVSYILQGDPSTTIVKTTGDNVGNYSFTNLTFKGDQSTGFPSQFSTPSEATGCLLMLFGSATAYGHDVIVKGCKFEDIKTVGIFIGYMRRAVIADNIFTFYEHTASYPYGQTNGPRVGVFAGAAPACDVSVTGNVFDGNVNGAVTTDDGADGFVWFSTGRDITVNGNVIRNYKLEGTQVMAGPSVVNGNMFFTKIGAASSIAGLLWSDGNAAIEKLVYSFTNNVVVGGETGVACNSLGVSGVEYFMVTGNIFNLASNVGAAVNISNASYAVVDGNACLQCAKFVYAVNSDTVKVSDNVVYSVSDIALLFNGALGKGASITGNILSGTNYHIYAIKPAAGVVTWMQVDNNIFLDGSNNQNLTPLCVFDAGAGTGTIRVTGLAGQIYRGTAAPSQPETYLKNADHVELINRSYGGPVRFEHITLGYSQAVFTAFRGLLAWGLLSPTAAAAGSQMLTGVAGQGIRVFNITVMMEGSAPWVAPAGSKIVIKFTGGSTAKIAEILASNLIGTAFPTGLGVVTGAIAINTPANTGIEMYLDDGAGNRINATSGSNVIVTCQCVMEWAA